MDDESKLRMERAIWGIAGANHASAPSLDCFFRYCQSEMRHAVVLAEESAERLNSVLFALDLLKSKYNTPKRELSVLHGDQSVIDLSVRLMLMTGCQAPGTIGGDIFRPRWRSEESLIQYMGRVYPQYDLSEGRGNQPLSLHKLSAHYLKRCANIDVQWTDHLTDHLLLLKGSDWKTLYVFAHPAFIFKSLQVLSDAGLKHDASRKEGEAEDAQAEALSRSAARR